MSTVTDTDRLRGTTIDTRNAVPVEVSERKAGSRSHGAMPGLHPAPKSDRATAPMRALSSPGLWSRSCPPRVLLPALRMAFLQRPEGRQGGRGPREGLYGLPGALHGWEG